MKKYYAIVILLMLVINGYSQTQNVNVSVDPRIELLSVILSTSDYDSIVVSKGSFHLITQFDFEYKNDLLATFHDSEKDPVVSTFMNLAYNYGFIFAMPFIACLCSDDLPDLAINKPLPEMLTKRSGGLKNLNSFLNDLSKFNKTWDFTAFMDKHKNYYSNILQSVRKYPIDRFVDQIEQYYGTSQAGYNIILASMIHPGGYGPNITDSLGNNHIYSIIGPKGISNGLPTFGSEEEFKYVIWHEFSHSFINPLVDSYYTDFEKYKSLLDPIKDKMVKHNSGDWNTCIAEHIVRAVTVRLAYLFEGEKAGEEAMKMETDQGFIYVKEICNRLKIFESDRAKYKTFQDFMPEIVYVFESLSENGS